MPRKAREKSHDAILHIMSRSISEVDLFKDEEDKKKYLAIIKKYQTTYGFKVYAYCLMDNHVHTIIDVNGADISKIMHSVNFSYAQYFNRRHKRHGHLFQDRFKSKIVTDDRYLIALSAYIHNNAMDIPKFKANPEKYLFSSLGVYLSLTSDRFNILDKDFILGLFSNDTKMARNNYLELVNKCHDKSILEEIEFENEETEYRSERTLLVRKFKPKEILTYIASKMNIDELKLHMKYGRDVVEAKALVVLLMRRLCNFKCKDICRILGNISQVRVSELSSLGVRLIDKDEKYKGMVKFFIENYGT